MPSRLKSQHTTCPQGHRGSPEDGQHGCSRAGGNCAFPCCSLARRGPGVCPACVAKFTKEAVSPAGCAGAKPPPSRKTFSLGGMCFLDGMPNCLSSMPFFRVLPPFLRSMCASQKPGTPGHWPSDRWRGTPSNYDGMRTDGGGFAPPCQPMYASSWTRTAVPSGVSVPQLRSSCATGAFGGMPLVGRLVHPGANVRCPQAGRF